MLYELTDDQISKFPYYVENGLKIGLDTSDNMDKDQIPLLLKEIYKMSGINPLPENSVVYTRCPAEACMVIDILSNNRTFNSVFGSTETKELSQAYYSSMLATEIDNQCTENFAEAVALGKTIIHFRRNKNIKSLLKGAISNNISKCLHGSHESYWISYYEFFKNETNIDLIDLTNYIKFTKMVGWWFPFEEICIISNKPSKEIKFDDRKTLHSEDSPAIFYYEDSPSNVWAWHGVRYSKQWADNLTPERAITEENLELRRVACEMLGWINILDHLNSKVIDIDDNPEIGELLEVDIPDIGTEKYLKVRCGTGRDFALPVPPNMKTAHQANAWTYGLDINDYNPEVRT